MFQYQQVLVRLREGDSDREIARSGLIGREKAAAFRLLAHAQGWLQAETDLPPEAQIATAVGEARRARSTVSSLIPWHSLVATWLDQGV